MLLHKHNTFQLQQHLADNTWVTFTDEMEAFLREHGSGPLLEAMQEELPRWRTEDFPLDGGRNPGYTPFEYITFTDELIQHTLTVQVLRPSQCFWGWSGQGLG